MKTRNLNDILSGVTLLFFIGLISIANQYNEENAMIDCRRMYPGDRNYASPATYSGEKKVKMRRAVNTSTLLPVNTSAR